MINLLEISPQALAQLCQHLEEKPFRAKQLTRWIHHSGESDFSRMTDLAKGFREKLEKIAIIEPPRLLDDRMADDGTRKWLLEAGPGNAIETVFIPESNREGRSRGTLCVSSQVGCALACRFCSTGRQGFNRDLTAAEIIGQLWWACKALGQDRAGRSGGAPGEEKPGRIITNVVLMGMGEPLLNFDHVVTALEIMLDDHAYGLSRRRVTVSTSGIVPAIDRLRGRCPVALAVSLHAPNDALREALMPINRKYPLKELMAACRRYVQTDLRDEGEVAPAGRKWQRPGAPRDFITFEYVLLGGINDSVAHARELVALVKDVPCKFNLIPFNPFPDSGFARSTPAAIRRFQNVLLEERFVATVRKTRGDDIGAACGQLAGQVAPRIRKRAETAEVAA